MEEKIIPTHGDSYNTLNFVHTQCVSVYKKVGYTPLQVVEDIRPFLLKEEQSRCTYVGRLDPMAEGWMHVLWSGDMKEKDELAGLKKTYEIDVVFDIQTDTGDALGLITLIKNSKITEEKVFSSIQDFIGPFTYDYPIYSSPNIKKTLKGDMQDSSRRQKGHVHKIDCLSSLVMSMNDLNVEIKNKLSHIHMVGDFRIDNIQDGWNSFFTNPEFADKRFLKIKMCVVCASGTYMRTLAEELGKKVDSCAFALHIKRIGVHRD